MSKELMNEVLEKLDSIKFFPKKDPKKDGTRMTILGGKDKAGTTIEPIQTFTLGLTRQYDKPQLVPSAASRRFPELHILLKKLMKSKDPTFKYTTITINKNLRSDFHIDKYNVGKSYGLSLGDFTGGGIEIKRGGRLIKLNTKNKLLLFDGHLEHRTLPYKGNRYSITFFRKKDDRIIKK
jgi:hypothetical protein